MLVANTLTGLAKYRPIFHWLPRYQGGWLRLDLLAGLTTAMVVIPQAMAYATIGGLPVQVGLYTVLTLMVIYAIWGTSRPLSVSSAFTISILVAAQHRLLRLATSIGPALHTRTFFNLKQAMEHYLSQPASAKGPDTRQLGNNS